MQGEDTCEGGGCSPVHKWIGRPLTGRDHLEAQCGFPCKQVGAFGEMYLFGRYDANTPPCAYS